MHWFIDPIKNHYFDFEGRVGRKPFWMFILATFIANLIVGFVAGLIDLPALSTLFALALLLPSLGIGARRLHDTGLSGWWQLLGIIPLLGTIVVLILMARPSQATPNKYGAAPGGGTATRDATAAQPNAATPVSDMQPRESAGEQRKQV